MLDNSVIHDIAEAVNQNEDISTILKNMKESLTSNAVGIAAPQIGVSKRIIMCKINGEWITMINPSWESRQNDKKISKEGCLSFPGVAVKMNRYYRVRVDYLDEDFSPHSLKLSASAAFIIQHECDHLEGITIICR